MIHAHVLFARPLGLFLYGPSLAFTEMRMEYPNAPQTLLDLEI